MFCSCKSRLTVVSIVFCSLICAIPATADLVFTVDKVAGLITITGGGKGVATKAQTTDNWDILDFQSDYLSDQYPTAEQPSSSASGTLTNLTTGLSETVTEFRVDRDTGSGDDIRFFITNALAFSLGDGYLLNLSATFDPSVLNASNLIIGSHIENSGGGADEIFGMTTLNVVIPEPSGLGMAILAAFVVRLRRTRRHV